MRVYLKDGTEAETTIEPVLLAHLAHAWRMGHIVVAIQIAQGDRLLLINMMNVDVDRTLKAHGMVAA